jgi:hypothetical protein
MNGPLGSNAWVFHTGALGDHVMIWPLLRALARQGTHVTLIAASSHAKLAETVIRGQLGGAAGKLRGLGAEQPRFTRMWSGSALTPDQIEPGIDTVLSFVADDASGPGRHWLTAARATFPSAAIACVEAPGSDSRRMLWARSNVRDWGKVAAAPANNGPITLFVGSGGASKRWPLAEWITLSEALGRSSPIRLLAGPVEAEQWSKEQAQSFINHGGALIGQDGDLAALEDAIRTSRLFIGADSGPTHLAAQLGIPTIALFGPTDPAVWSPSGPQVRVVAPETPGSMDWLTRDRVLNEILAVANIT